ncbi:hypothetical protein A2U01_0007309 [Trifolium medium]|uniref:Uncharacterized protein n=1 Tax=Trifolium medium TaxID=97028 RepID=A0A392MG35_9FABA|nr:hypothetical protein [Trifolium medium]
MAVSTITEGQLPRTRSMIKESTEGGSRRFFKLRGAVQEKKVMVLGDWLSTISFLISGSTISHG